MSATINQTVTHTRDSVRQVTLCACFLSISSLQHCQVTSWSFFVCFKTDLLSLPNTMRLYYNYNDTLSNEVISIFQGF